MSVSQKDRRVLDRFLAVVGIGRIKGPYTQKGSTHCPMFQWVAYTFEEVQAVIAMLWNWLGPIKREQARNALSRYHLSFVQVTA